jgi:hypothetical protein
MTDILVQLNPAALSAIIILIVLSVLGIIVLRLVKAGKARNPGDLVKVARERAAAAKAGKEAQKQAEAAIAEPIATSRLSRISGRSDYAESEAEAEAVDEEAAAEAAAIPDHADDIAADDDGSEAGFDAQGAEPVAELPEVAASPEFADATDEDDEEEPFAEQDYASLTSYAAPQPEPERENAVFDLADPAHHPQNWDELVATIDVLEQTLTRPWAEDRMTLQLSRDQLAASAAGDEAMTLALSRQLSATDLARTINSAAREQAAEVVAVVREFAHQAPFSADECAAVMGGLSEIQWMALVPYGDALDKRTLPLTRHDPEAPLWVEEARDSISRLRRAMAA